MKVNNICKIYDTKTGEKVHALKGVSFDLPSTGMVAILGKSGSGKSTLLNVLSGLDRFDSGDIECFGKNMKNFSSRELDHYRNSCVGFVFQEYHLIPELDVCDNIALALQLQGQSGVEEKIQAALKQVDLAGYENRKIEELSGGQKQRVAIARALVKDPKIIFADEPTGALDSQTGESILQILKGVAQEKLVILVTHDWEFAEKYGDRVIELADGLVIRDSGESYHSTEAEKEMQLRKSRMPIKSALKIGCSNFQYHPIRLISTVVLSVMAFLMLGVSLITGTMTYSDLIYDYLHSKNIPSSMLLRFDGDYPGRFSREEQAAIRQQMGGDTVPIRYTELTLDADCDREDVLPYMIAQVSQQSLSYLNMAYEGRLPAAENEIAISKALAHGLSPTGSFPETRLRINGSEYLVTAIIDTGEESASSLQNALFVWNMELFGQSGDILLDTPCDFHIVESRPIDISKLIQDDASIEKYDLREKPSGIYLPISMMGMVLNSVPCTMEYDGIYYRNYGQLFDALLRSQPETTDVQAAYLAAFERLVKEYALEADFSYRFKSSLYGFDYRVNVDGFYFQENTESENALRELVLHESLFQDVYALTQGQCDAIIVPVQKQIKPYLDQDGAIRVVDPIVAELYAREQNLVMFTDIADVLSLIFSVFSALLLMSFIIQSLSDKTKTVGILRAFGSDHFGIMQIFIWEGLTIGISVFLISAVSLFGVCEILNALFADFIGFDVTFWHMDLLVGGCLFLLSIVFSFIGCVIPIIKLIRLHPTEIIRSDI